MYKIGDRVGAVLSVSKEEGVLFLGYGIYEGDFYPEEAIGFFADCKKKMIAEGKAKKTDDWMTNPRIRLDNGKVVYGCECWWGNIDLEDYVKKGYKIINVDIEQYRENILLEEKDAKSVLSAPEGEKHGK
jgi:hypothetical protein